MQAEMTRLYNGLATVAARYLGKRLILTSGDRSCREQKAISGNNSYHLNGWAFDAQLYPYNRSEQAWLGRLAEAYGYRWGGRFKGNYDDIHFDNGNRVRGGTCP